MQNWVKYGPTSFVFLILLTSVVSCAPSGRVLTQMRTESNYCYPNVLYSYDSSLKPADSVQMMALKPQKSVYSWRSLMVANAVGILMIMKSMDGDAKDGVAYQA